MEYFDKQLGSALFFLKVKTKTIIIWMFKPVSPQNM